MKRWLIFGLGLRRTRDRLWGDYPKMSLRMRLFFLSPLRFLVLLGFTLWGSVSAKVEGQQEAAPNVEKVAEKVDNPAKQRRLRRMRHSIVKEYGKNWPSGTDPLLQAALLNIPDIVRRYIANEADLDASTNPSGLTALALAVYKGNYEIAALLVNNGAKVDIQTNDGYPFLSAMVEENKLGAVQWLLKTHAQTELNDAEGFTPLLVAIQSGEIPMVRALIQGGADINYPGGVNFPPLIAAVSRGNLALTRELLTMGAKVNAQTDEGATALHYAVGNDFTAVVDLLLEHCANPKLEDKTGRSPISHARQRGDTQLVKRLRGGC